MPKMRRGRDPKPWLVPVPVLWSFSPGALWSFRSSSFWKMTLKSRGTELGDTRGTDSSGVWESPSIQPPASLLDVCYSTDTPGGGFLCRIAGQILLGPHSCLPPSDYFSQTGAGWEVEVFTFKSFMCVHFTLCGWAWREEEGGFHNRVKFPFRGYYHACGVAALLASLQITIEHNRVLLPSSRSLSFFFSFPFPASRRLLRGWSWAGLQRCSSHSNPAVQS